MTWQAVCACKRTAAWTQSGSWRREERALAGRRGGRPGLLPIVWCSYARPKRSSKSFGQQIDQCVTSGLYPCYPTPTRQVGNSIWDSLGEGQTSFFYFTFMIIFAVMILDSFIIFTVNSFILHILPFTFCIMINRFNPEALFANKLEQILPHNPKRLNNYIRQTFFSAYKS